jgi:hypothetical protein
MPKYLTAAALRLEWIAEKPENNTIAIIQIFSQLIISGHRKFNIRHNFWY